MKINKKSDQKDSINFHAIGYRFLSDIPAKRLPFSEKIRENLLRAHLKVNHVVYISSMFFWSLIAFILALPTSMLLTIFILPILDPTAQPVLSIFYSILISILAGGVTLGIFLYYPSYAANNIKRRIEKDLVYTANYMSILSGAGATTGETFSSLVRVGKVFGIDESAKAIIKNIEFLGEDTVTAIDEESKRTPSKDYADFLQGYISTTQTGGSSKAYLEAMAEKFMDNQKRQLSKIIEQLNLAGEIFVMGLIAFPIIIVTMLSIMGFFGGDVLGGLSAPQLMSLVTYIFIPFIAAGILVFIDAAMSSW